MEEEESQRIGCDRGQLRLCEAGCFAESPVGRAAYHISSQRQAKPGGPTAGLSNGGAYSIDAGERKREREGGRWYVQPRRYSDLALGTRRKSHLGGQAEGGTEHSLCGRDITHLQYGYPTFLFGIAWC